MHRPSDNQPYGEIPLAGPEGVDQAVRFAQNALKESGWSTRAPRERAGGYKQSGIGKDPGRQAYASSLKYKSVLMAFGD